MPHITYICHCDLMPLETKSEPKNGVFRKMWSVLKLVKLNYFSPKMGLLLREYIQNYAGFLKRPIIKFRMQLRCSLCPINLIRVSYWRGKLHWNFAFPIFNVLFYYFLNTCWSHRSCPTSVGGPFYDHICMISHLCRKVIRISLKPKFYVGIC